jgi:ketosteroid isomerase-like protein
MKSLLLAFLGLFVAATLPVGAQTKPDEEAVRKLPQAFADAWAKHDGHELAKIMADDVDFVTVGAAWLHGRPDFEK